MWGDTCHINRQFEHEVKFNPSRYWLHIRGNMHLEWGQLHRNEADYHLLSNWLYAGEQVGQESMPKLIPRDSIRLEARWFH